MSKELVKDFINDFVQESRELIDELEFDIVTLNNQIDDNIFDSEQINKIFRSYHSLKGVAGFLEFINIQTVAHTSENLLDLIRSEKLKIEKKHTELLIMSIDFLKESIGVVEKELEDVTLKDWAEDIKEQYENELSGKNKKSSKKSKTKIKGKSSKKDSSKQDHNDKMKTLEKCSEILNSWKKDIDNLQYTKKLYEKCHSLRENLKKLNYQDSLKMLVNIEILLVAINSGVDIDKKQVVDIFLQLFEIISESLLKQPGDDSIPQIDLYLELLKDFMPDVDDDDDIPKLGQILEDEGVVSKESIDKALKEQNRQLGEILVDMGETTPESIEKALEKQKTKKEKKHKQVQAASQFKDIQNQQNIRVDIKKLDLLSNLMGELVIANNIFAHNPGLIGHHLRKFKKDQKNMLKIIRDLQEVVMSIRMIPVAGLFKRMMRQIHNLSSKSGKKVEMIVSGESTEIDKTVIEIITDPLVHIIRNAIDHGLERPEERVEKGKPEKGIVYLSAQHEEGEIWITIEDDGNGIDKEGVFKKAVSKGIVSEDAALTDDEVYSLIFEPGFSTAEQVTDISGRGVGMDVVRRNLEKINGNINVSSVYNQGTKIILRIPLTLAIIEGIFVDIGESSYMIPILFIKEFFKPKKELITMLPDGREMVKIRKDMIPIVRLHKIYENDPKFQNFEDGILIIVDSKRKTLALFVDSIRGQQQAVIKSLPEAMRDVNGISGCTILGNGDISMIVDVERISEIMA